MTRFLKRALLLGLAGLFLWCCTLGCKGSEEVVVKEQPEGWGEETRRSIVEGD